MERKPIVFAKSVQVRFSDIDRYQHVNTIYYPDYLFTSRFEFQKETYGLDGSYFDQQGIGFYTIRFEAFFRKMIPASAARVWIESFVEKVEGGLLKMKFKFSNEAGDLLYCEGGVDMFVIDLKTQKPFRTIPDTMLDLVFEKAQS